jgi:hypothetical protein
MAEIAKGLGRVGEVEGIYRVYREGDEYIFAFEVGTPGYSWKFAIPAKDMPGIVEAVNAQPKQ